MPNEPVAMQLPRKPVLSNAVSPLSESSTSTASARSPPISPRPSISEQMNLPIWLQERTPSVHSRPSRASSIMSTRTGISINTLQEPILQDDARSIDVHFGEQAFRISRDGSRVTDHQYLPPYSTSPLPYVREESSESLDIEDVSSLGDPGYSRSGSGILPENQDSSPDGPPTPKSTRSQLSQQGRTSAQDHFSRPISSRTSSGPPLTEYTLATQNLNRQPSFTPGHERLSVDKRRTVSEGDILTSTQIPPGNSLTEPPFKRRNAIRLPRLTINQNGNPLSSSGPNSVTSQRGSDSPRSRETQSAGPILKTPSHAQKGTPRRDSGPSSPSFIGRNAPGIFPAPQIVISRGEESSTTTTRPSEPSTPTASASASGPNYTLPSPATIEEGYPETHPPPAMDSENDISIHYTRLIRSIDRTHRATLHARDVDLASLRSQLHEKDTVYRQELRARDFLIDDLRVRLEHLERGHQAALEGARNEVEDLWEARWKDRDRHLMDRMRRMEGEGQRMVERAVRERDREWAAEWAVKQRGLVEGLGNGRGVGGAGN